MSMEPQTPSEEFIRQLTAHQARLYGLILSLLPDAHAAKDILQDTNVVLWRKCSDFELGTNFGSWAATVAYYQVAAYRKSRGRDRHYFDDDLLTTICSEAEQRFQNSDEREIALDSCLQRLGESERDLLRKRYTEGYSVADLAEQIGKTASATRVALFRLRHLLLECIETKTSS